MRAAALFFTALSFAGSCLADGPPEGIAPTGASPDGCEQTVDGNFTINIAYSVSKRETANDAAGSATVCHLSDGILKDTSGRVGSIVANHQFQFDGPPQAGAIYTGGFSVCKNNSLALGSTARWWRCMSGDFGNLYDESIGDQCTEIRIVASMLGSSSSSSSSAASSTATSDSSSGTGSGSASATGSATGTETGTAATTQKWSTVAATTTASSNASVTSGSPTGTSATGGPSAASNEAPAASSGAAVPTRQYKTETFAAVVGIMGAAMLL